MDIFLIALLILVFLFLRKVPAGALPDSYLCKDDTMALRGVMAVLIILHHMSEKIGSGYVFPYLANVGYLFVAVFFFLSGYGLFVSYKKKGQDYLQGFWKNRILYIVLIYTLIFVVYLLEKIFIIGKSYNAIELVVAYFSSGITDNCWYIIAQVLFYIFFWISFKLFNKSELKAIICVGVFQIIFNAVCMIIGANSFWYVSNLAFTVGLLWGLYRDKIISILNKKFWICLISVSVIYVVLFIAPSVLSRLGLDNGIIKAIIRMLSTSVFAIIAAILMYKIRITGKLWLYLGKISLEIYILQGLVYNGLRNNHIRIENDILWCLATIIITIALASLAYKFNEKLRRLIRK